MHVVAADDDPVMQRILALALEQIGCSVTVVADGQEAWEAIERERPPLVVLDWHMPHLDGLEVCRRIRASDATRDAFVLVITGRSEPEDLQVALDTGADDYLAKPVEPAQLLARLTIARRRIALDDERRHAVAELARARWLAGVGELAIAVQHEINNPLAALCANVELLASSPDATPEQRELAAAIADEARSIADIVRRLTTLDDPRSVEYLTGIKMIDLSDDRTR